MNHKTKADCNSCGHGKTHSVLCTERTTWNDSTSKFWCEMLWEMLKCDGCEDVKLRLASHNSDSLGDPPEVYFYPPISKRRVPTWLSYDDDGLGSDNVAVYKLMKQVYSALDNNLLSLASMGIRALLEHVMISKTGDRGTFGMNLAAFEKAQHVSPLQRTRLETILDAGHAAMHRAYFPSFSETMTLVEIAESIIESVYIHDRKIEALKKNVPPRTRRKKG